VLSCACLNEQATSSRLDDSFVAGFFCLLLNEKRGFKTKVLYYYTVQIHSNSYKESKALLVDQNHLS